MTKPADRVVINTGILYMKMILTVGISLYTTRAVLLALGQSDFGLYNLVAGVVALLSFLNAAMSTSTQRFLSVSQGSGNAQKQSVIFSNSLLVHIILSVVLAVFFLILEPFLFDHFLNIDVERVNVAKVIYYFMIASVVFSVLSVPFVASLNARENMLWIAIVGIVEVLLKLGIALSIPYFAGDKLIYYGLLIVIVNFISFILYMSFCLKKYDECSLDIKRQWSPSLSKELTSFAGWNLFGALCGLGRTQGLAIVLNLFFGTIVNAAYGIANQVAGQMNFFSATMLRALNPQIMKSAGAKDWARMKSLSMTASKFGFFLLAIFAVPCIFEMEEILSVWLKLTPDYAIEFCRLLLVGILLNQLTIGLQSALQAVGKIRVYQSIVGGLLLLNLPIAYFLLRSGLSAYIVLVSYILIEFFACIIRMLIAKRIGVVDVNLYLKKVILPIIITLVPVLFIGVLIIQLNIECHFLLICGGLCITYVVFIWLIGLDKSEQQYVKNIFSSVKGKLWKS